MRKIAEWKIFGMYLLVLFLLVASHTAFSQVKVIHFNADFNSANDVVWFSKLKECDRQTLLIEQNDNQTKYEIAIVPTIVVFDDGEEVKKSYDGYNSDFKKERLWDYFLNDILPFN